MGWAKKGGRGSRGHHRNRKQSAIDPFEWETEKTNSKSTERMRTLTFKKMEVVS